MRRVKFVQLDVANPNTVERIVEVLDSGNFINGPYTKRFAKEWAHKCGAGYAVLTSNGSAAIRAALATIKSSHHMYVIMPALSFVATAAAVYHSGLIPVYCDVTDDGLMDWDMCRTYFSKLNGTVAAIMPVHLYGQVMDIPEDIVQLSLLVEDACQAHGAFTMNTRSGSLVCFSFYPSKNLGAAGDAGAVVTNIGKYARDMAAFINYGDYAGEKYVHSMIGDNLRCSEIQAAILSSHLGMLQSNNTKRVALAAAYHAGGVASIATAKVNAWHLYPILAREPDRLRTLLGALGVETGRHYPYILPHVVNGVCDYKTIHATRIARHVVTLPIGPHMDDADITQVITAVTKLAQLNDDGMWEII